LFDKHQGGDNNLTCVLLLFFLGARMETTKLSSKGQVIIPKAFRTAHSWDSGLELAVIEMGDGLLLRPVAPFAETHLDEVAGSLPYSGPFKSQEDISAALKRGTRDVWRDRG